MISGRTEFYLICLNSLNITSIMVENIPYWSKPLAQIKPFQDISLTEKPSQTLFDVFFNYKKS